MNRSKTLLFLVLAPISVLAPNGFAGLILNAPIDVIGSLPTATFVANGYGTNTYKDWGNEPSIAVNPNNLNQIVISSFSYGTNNVNSGANLFYSTTGGSTWTAPFSVPAPANNVGIPNDWRFAYDSTGTLHGVVLGGCNNCNIYQGSTTNPASLAAWTWTGGGAKINNASSTNNADQPWIAVANGGKVFAAYDDFSSPGLKVRVATSSNNGTSFPLDTGMNNGALATSVNPGTRIATDGNGSVYGIYTIGSSLGGGVHNVTYYLNRSSDGGATWDFSGSSAAGGLVIGSGVSDQLNNAGTQAVNNWFAGVNDLRGSYTAVAADSTGSHIYAVWGKRDASNIDRIYITEYHPSGSGLAAGSTSIVSVAGQWAALPSVAVLADGTVSVMYDSYDAGNRMVHVHVASSTDFGASFGSDSDMYSFMPLTLLQATGSTNTNREFGDYQFITAVGNNLFGSFVARGNDNGTNNTSNLVDPFFFSGADVVVPEPATMGLMAGALAAIGMLRRRRK